MGRDRTGSPSVQTPFHEHHQNKSLGVPTVAKKTEEDIMAAVSLRYHHPFEFQVSFSYFAMSIANFQPKIIVYRGCKYAVTWLVIVLIVKIVILLKYRDAKFSKQTWCYDMVVNRQKWRRVPTPYRIKKKICFPKFKRTKKT